MEPVTASVLGAGISTVGNAAASVSSGLFGKKKAYEYNSRLQEQQAKYNREAQWLAFERNKELSEYAYDREMQQWARENQANLNFWRMQNEYNTPGAQMARYQAAGLNPNLIYGQSNTADQVTAASSPNYNATPMQAEQMSGGSGVGDDLRMSIGDPVQEYYKILQMQQSLENSKKQGDVLDSQANLNNMNALFGETRNRQLLSTEPYWASNAQFDNVAKKIANDISSANLSALLFSNEKMLPLKARELELLNSLRSQNLDFNKLANPLKIKELSQNIDLMRSRQDLTDMLSNTEDLKQRKLDLDYAFDRSLKEYVDKGDLGDNTLRRLFLYFVKALAH